MNRFIWPLAIFSLLVVLLLVGLSLDPREVPSPLIDKPAPAFVLPDLYNPQEQISPADYYGKVWLLNVWASWCVACRSEHPILVDAVRRHDLLLIGLNYKDENAVAQQWLRQYGNPYVTSAEDVEGVVGIDWGVYGVPETFVIDKKGIIRYKQIGPVTEKALQQKILPLIKQLEGEAA